MKLKNETEEFPLVLCEYQNIDIVLIRGITFYRCHGSLIKVDLAAKRQSFFFGAVVSWKKHTIPFYAQIRSHGGNTLDMDR